MTYRRFAIADIHGCVNTFEHLIHDILFLSKKDYLFLLGDYIDRGPNSQKVIDSIISLTEKGYKIFSILGNHEKMLLDAFYSHFNFITWIRNGGRSTLDSYNVKSVGDIPKSHIDFFKSLQYYIKLPDFILVHAGLNCRQTDPLLDKESMIWTRDPFVDLSLTSGRKVVAGHTPCSISTIRKSLHSNKILIDGGCVYAGRFQDSGMLCAIDLDTFELFYSNNMDTQ